ncbi:MAG: AbrB/MazE/SpoVT family DNA-binding domain-containing protein [Alphaproteobacteria bacterium]|nr:AbrB/MazE/SpoVT family DNA-binding domain-containing protein [Alphaproteobacteria bacterium]
MHGAVARWGNSLALRLPKSVAQHAGLTEGSAVRIEVEADRLVIRPARKRYRLADLLAKETRRKRHGEESWGPRRGKEAW